MRKSGAMERKIWISWHTDNYNKRQTDRQKIGVLTDTRLTEKKMHGFDDR